MLFCFIAFVDRLHRLSHVYRHVSKNSMAFFLNTVIHALFILTYMASVIFLVLNYPYVAFSVPPLPKSLILYMFDLVDQMIWSRMMDTVDNADTIWCQAVCLVKLIILSWMMAS